MAAPRQAATENHSSLSGCGGVGKTVLLNMVKTIAERWQCHVAMVEAHDDKPLPLLLVPEIRRILLAMNQVAKVKETVKSALRVFRSFLGAITLSYEGLELSLGVDPETGVADSGDLETDLVDLFLAIGKAAKTNSKTIVFIVDEMQYLSEKELSALIMALHKVSQEGLPVLLAGAGLPLIIGKSGESKSYAERLFDFPAIDALGFDDAATAITEPARKEGVEFQQAALEEIHTLTKGYPYFIQQWAYICWNTAARSPITLEDVHNSTVETIRRLDQNFFRVRFDRLTPREKTYLRAMAELGPGPHRSGDIATKLGVVNTKLGPCRANLISKGMIYSPEHGNTAFTVPLFDQYIKRVMPFEPWVGS